MADTEYGVHIGLTFPELAQERLYSTLLVFRAPGGYIRVYNLGQVTYKRYKASTMYVYWPLVGSEFFSDLYGQSGTIPIGQYSVACYLDGMLAADAVFNVY